MHNTNLELSDVMYVQEVLYVATVVCNYCSTEFATSTKTELINLGYGPEAIVPEIWCKKCGCRDVTEIYEEDDF